MTFGRQHLHKREKTELRKGTDNFPTLAAPPVPQSPLPFFKYIRVIRDNLIAGFHEDVYTERIVERRFLWFHSFIINDPDGVKRVLVDNVSNYVKADVVLPIVRPVLGNGLVTSEGETWRTHRKIMAPCFGPRVIPKYAAAM